jgi:hypothetical protein
MWPSRLVLPRTTTSHRWSSQSGARCIRHPRGASRCLRGRERRAWRGPLVVRDRRPRRRSRGAGRARREQRGRVDPRRPPDPLPGSDELRPRRGPSPRLPRVRASGRPPRGPKSPEWSPRPRWSPSERRIEVDVVGALVGPVPRHHGEVVAVGDDVRVHGTAPATHSPKVVRPAVTVRCHDCIAPFITTTGQRTRNEVRRLGSARRRLDTRTGPCPTLRA